MHFGATLRLLRTDAGISLRALANEVGVSSAYLSRVENGHDAVPTPDRLIAIARALRLPPALIVELAHKVEPFVSSYLERVPAAGALFVDIARRNLTAPQLARIRAFIDAELTPDAREDAHGASRLSRLLAPERVVLRLSCSHLEDVIDVAATRLALDAPEVSPSRLADAILRREQESSTALGEAVSVPHAIVPGLRSRGALVTLARPLDAATPDGQPLRLVVVLLLEQKGVRQLELLAQVATLAAPGVAASAAALRDPREAIRWVEMHGQ